MNILIGLLLFVVGYVVSKFLLDKAPAIAPLVDVLSIVCGVAFALLTVGKVTAMFGL